MAIKYEEFIPPILYLAKNRVRSLTSRCIDGNCCDGEAGVDIKTPGTIAITLLGNGIGKLIYSPLESKDASKA